MRSISRVAAAIGLAVVIASSSCSSLKVESAFNHQGDFTKYRTWAWKDDGSIKDAVWKRRVQSVLEDELALHGLKPTEQNPDLWVAVHWRLSVETRVVSYDPAWGYGWGYWADPGWTQVYDIPSGMMIIDLVDVGKKEIAFRGRASAEIREGKENEEREQRFREILTQMFATYPAAR